MVAEHGITTGTFSIRTGPSISIMPFHCNCQTERSLWPIAATRPGTYRIEVQASGDGGIHWALRGMIATGHVGLWEPFLLLLPSGVVQAYYASEEGCKPDQRIEMRSSSDGGKTWGSPVTVAQKKGSRDGMPGVVRLDKEELLAVFEAQDDSPYRFVIRGVRSSDNGRTWATTRELIYRPRNPVVNRWAAGAPSIIRLPDKRLLVSFQSDEQVSYLQGDRRRDPAVPGYDYVRHSHFAYVASSDNGRTWTRPQHLLGSPEQPACWNALYGSQRRDDLGPVELPGPDLGEDREFYDIRHQDEKARRSDQSEDRGRFRHAGRFQPERDRWCHDHLDEGTMADRPLFFGSTFGAWNLSPHPTARSSSRVRC